MLISIRDQSKFKRKPRFVHELLGSANRKQADTLIWICIVYNSTRDIQHPARLFQTTCSYHIIITEIAKYVSTLLIITVISFSSRDFNFSQLEAA